MRPLLSFFTALPFGPYPLDAAARASYLLPLVGVLTGAAGAAPFGLVTVLPATVCATLALSACLLAAGLHHADGVLDVGDALMVRGTPERRREVLNDARVGIGGIFALFVLYAPALAALVPLSQRAPVEAALALLAAETASRSVMVLLMSYGKSADPASSTVPFVRSLKGWRRVAGTASSLLVPLVFLGLLGPAQMFWGLLVPLVAALAVRFSTRAFGGITGDTVGAACETTRAVILVALSATL